MSKLMFMCFKNEISKKKLKLILWCPDKPNSMSTWFSHNP